jgi:L-alanine-DL-glutamate epimerase-like enolase superfamily enzyme
MEMLLVKVETSSGVVGWGEAFPLIVWPLVKCALETIVAPLVIGKPEDGFQSLIEDLRRKLHLFGRGGPVTFAVSGLDIALWDVAGKKAGRPLSELLGGAKRSSLPAYASLMKYADPEVMASNCRRALGMGYKAIKIHDHRGVEQTALARQTIGNALDLMLDVNCSWSREQALGYLPRFEELKLKWLEEPVWPPENVKDLRVVRSKTTTPIAAGENASSAYDIVNLAESNAVDLVQPSVIKIGGVSEIASMVKRVEASRASMTLHSPYFGPGFLATLHIASTLAEESPIEDYFCDLPANPLGAIIKAKNGRFTVPTGAGLGRDPDPLVIRDYQVH